MCSDEAETPRWIDGRELAYNDGLGVYVELSKAHKAWYWGFISVDTWIDEMEGPYSTMEEAKKRATTESMKKNAPPTP